jgi:transglutaminase-like putative cysteine protease
MQRALLADLLVLCVSILLLSALFDSLASYFWSLSSSGHKIEWFPYEGVQEEPRLIFAVLPAYPAIYWRIGTADYYDGFSWSGTTNESKVEEFPKTQNNEDVQVFTVEMNATEEVTFLPVPPSETSVTNPIMSPPRDYELRLDDLAGGYGIRILGKDSAVGIIYNASWHHVDYNEINESLVSFDDAPQKIRSIYLQLPTLPDEVWELANELKKDSYKALDQILADVQHLRVHFDYDFDLWEGKIQRLIHRDWVYSYMQWKKGICIDAATALTIILRCQGIPARISYGFKPEKTDENKTYYYSTGAHAWTEVYLPPYGWMSFDATPPAADFPRLEVLPIKGEGFLGEKVFYYLKVVNKRDARDYFKLFVYNKKGWSAEAIPNEVAVKPLETRDVLIEFTVPENACPGEMNVFTIQATSSLEGQEFSAIAVTEVGKNKRIPTITMIDSADEFVWRSGSFHIRGRVYTVSGELLNDVPVFILLSTNEKGKGVVVGKNSSLIGNFLMDCKMPSYVNIGNHSAVSICLGDSKYAPSISSTFVVKVYAKTSLEINVKTPTLVGDSPTVYGRLLFDDQSPVQNALITLEILEQNKSLTKWSWKNFTGLDGTFLTIYPEKFKQLGLFEINVTYLGSEFIIGSDTKRIINVTYGSPTINSFTENLLVRGENCLIQGKVDLDNEGLWKEPVTIMFDEDLLLTVETDSNGLFAYTFCVPPKTKLGTHTLIFALQTRGSSINQTVHVMAKTKFSIADSDKKSGNNWLSLSVSLLDDQDLPVEEAEIVVENYRLVGKTDNEGNVSFLLDTVKLQPEKIDLVLRFKGSELYLSTATIVTVVAEPLIPIGFMLPVAIAVSVALTFVANRQLFYLKITKASLAKQREHSSMTKSERESLIRIRFPDITDPFLGVWGIGDKLRIECLVNEGMQKRAEGKTVDFFVNYKTTAKGIFSKGYATVSHIFVQKGAYQVTAKWINKPRRQATSAEATLRIVNYGEEIVNLYGAFLQNFAQKYVSVEADITAREIERLLLSIGKFDSESLRKVTDYFEKAEYSDHSIIRKDYEIMYQALKELNFDVG